MPTVNQPVWKRACRSGLLAPYTNLQQQREYALGHWE